MNINEMIKDAVSYKGEQRLIECYIKSLSDESLVILDRALDVLYDGVEPTIPSVGSNKGFRIVIRSLFDGITVVKLKGSYTVAQFKSIVTKRIVNHE